jgi:regulator of sigma E protease
MTGFLFTVAILFIVLGVLVFVHELGHYWAAKRFGVWVHRFAIGIGSPIKALSFRRGETEWAIAWLPLGGYVKMASSEEDPSSGVLEGGAENAQVPPDRVFEAKPIWQRMVIILAGVTLNLVFAWLVFVGLAFKNGRQYDPTTTLGRVDVASLPAEATALAELTEGTRITAVDGREVTSWDDIAGTIAQGRTDSITLAFADRAPITVHLHRDALSERVKVAQALRPLHPAVIGAISPSYPAREAGMEIGDSIVAIDGTPIGQWEAAVSAIQAAPNRPLAITVMRDGAPQQLTITPREEFLIPGDSTTPVVGRIGAGVRTPYITEPMSIGQAMGAGSRATLVAAGSIFRTFRGLFTGRVSTKEVGGPIMIGQMAADQARAGIEPLLAFMALISVNLAVVNLLPIPVLDGGAFLILLVEGIIRRPIPTKLREVIQLAGLAFVVLLMVTAFWNDIARLLGR